MGSTGNSMATRQLRAGAARWFLCALLLAVAPGVLAQQPPIQQQMTPAQFKAAGLDQLNSEQLANLNAWLDGTIQVAASKAAVIAKKQLEDDNRGFLNFGSSEPVTGSIAGEFSGFGRGRIYTLDNGQVWQQTDDASLAGVKLVNPAVRITPSMIGNAWFLQVGSYNTRAKVLRVK